jgi:WD40 repeat protein
MFSHDGSRVASGSDDKMVRIWDDGEKLIYKAVENAKRLIGGYVTT